MALRDTLRNLIGIPENDYDNDYDDEMQSGNIDQQEEEQTSICLLYTSHRTQSSRSGK